jgi:hypothetical protein
MGSNRDEQIEALEVLTEFNDKLLKNMHIITKELSGQRLDDTDKFLTSIIEAMNWEINVVNGTMDVLNDGKKRVDKEKFNSAIVSFGKAVADKDDREMAAEFENVIPIFEQLGVSAREVI